jgi:predicted alpha/beta superfamily hydrolase
VVNSDGVGIDRGQRMREFLPYKDYVSSPASPGPAGKQFPDFLASEMVPFVAGRYRIEKGPPAIVGSSYGAIAALDALLQLPDLFTPGLIERPSLAVGNGRLFRNTEHLFKGPSRVYLGMGERDSGGRRRQRGKPR